MLTDAQLLLGLSRHLSAYSYSPSVAELDGLNYAGQVLDIAWRLRGSTVSTIARVIAIGVDARVPKRQIITQVLPTMEQLDWVFVERDQKGNIQSVECHVPPATELESSAALLLELTILTGHGGRCAHPDQVDHKTAANEDRRTRRMLRPPDDAAESALSSLAAVNLVRIQMRMTVGRSYSTGTFRRRRAGRFSRPQGGRTLA